MYDAEDQERKRAAREQRAQARGECIRAELKVRLVYEDARSAADLMPHMAMGVSLSEVAFSA